MKKILSIAMLAMFFIAFSSPAFCDSPPKAKTEANSDKSRKYGNEKCKEKCSGMKEKGETSSKCSGDKKTGCCKEKATTEQAK